MVNKPLIRPYFWGGYVRGGRLTSHEIGGRRGVWHFGLGLGPLDSPSLRIPGWTRTNGRVSLNLYDAGVRVLKIAYFEG